MSIRMRKFICLLSVAVLVILTAGCGAKNKNGKVYTYNDKTAYTASSGGDWRVTDSDNLSYVCAAGLIELYYDKLTTGFSVYDTDAGHFWNALPTYETQNACLLQVTLLSENGRFILNSQDNSLAFASYGVDFAEDGFTVTYYMSDSEKTVKKSTDSLNAGELYVIVPVQYILTDAGLNVSVNCGSVYVSDGYQLETLSLLPYFGCLSYTQEAVDSESRFVSQSVKRFAESGDNGAENENEAESDGTSVETVSPAAAAEDDFLLVPDGCGGVVYTRFSDENTQRMVFKVYGDAETDTYVAEVGAYGIKNNGCAVAAVITAGAELSSIHAERAGADEDSVNRVYASFRITPTETEDGNVYYGRAFTGEIGIEYRFLSAKQANAVSMAAACREVLIRTGLLSAKTVEDSALPLNIGITGSVDGGYKTSVSDFEEAEDLLGQLKAKGVNSVNLILNGFFEDGLLQSSSSSLSPLKKLGGNSAFEELCDYASKQKLSLFAGVNILTAHTLSDTAENLTGEKITLDIKNPLYPYFGKEYYEIRRLSPGKAEKNIIRLMNASKNYTITGFCLNDIGGVYADYGSDDSDLITAAKEIGEAVSSFSVRKDLMLRGCPFYAVKDASYLLDVPFYTQYTVSEGYEAVPFLPALLHSTVRYSPAGCNTKSVMKLEMLKCVEYGGVPYFEWVFDMNSHLYYGLTVNDVVEFAVKASEKLGDLSSARMVNHSKIEDGVFLTEYDTGAYVYVNYNSYSVNIGSISVAPYDYIRIN